MGQAEIDAAKLTAQLTEIAPKIVPFLGPVWKRRSPAPTTASGDWSNGAWNTNDVATRDGAFPSVQPANRAIEAIRQRMRMPRPCPYPVRLETPFLARRIPCTHELRRALFAVS
jgi:hypothetical protein